MRPGLWVAALSAGTAALQLTASSYSSALPLIRREWDLSYSTAGMIFAAYQIGYVLAVLALLPLTDRVSSVRLYAWSAVVAFAANTAFPLWAQGAWSAAALRGLTGAAMVGVYMPGLRLIAERFGPDRRGTAIGVYSAAFALGNTLSLAFTGALIPLVGWRWAYGAMAIAGGIAPTLAFLLQREDVAAPRQAAAAASGRLDLTVLRNRPALLVILAYVAHSWELYVARGWLPAFLAATFAAGREPGPEAVARAGLIVAVATGVGAVASLLAGAASDRFGRSRTAMALLGASAACSLAIGWLGAAPARGLLAIVLVYGCALPADSAIYSTSVTELAEPNRLGSIMAVQSFLGFSATVIGPMVSGALLDLFGGGPAGWGLAFGSAGLVALAGVACLHAGRARVL